MKTAQSHSDFGPTPNEILGDEISGLAAHIHAATHRFLVLIREFDQREAWAEMGARSCAHWLNWRCGISVHTAREKIRVAHALATLEKISAAFASGELSYSKVRAVTRIANADNEETLLNIALSGTASQLERLVQCELRAEREADVNDRTEAAFTDREFGWHNDSDGSVVFHGRLPAELAERVIKAIDTAAKEVPAETSPTLKTRRADALVALADQTCEGFEVTLHVSAETPSSTGPQRADAMETTGTIPSEAALRMCCDAGIVPVTEDAHGNILNIGRKTRQIPSAMRRALEIRDKGCCRFPSCTQTRFLQGHHIHHWAHGGETCLDNLVLLCWHHHRLVHEGGFGCRVVKGKKKKGVRFVFERPDGVIIPDAFRLRPVTTPLEQQHENMNIDASTCDARDGQSRFDVDVVIDALAFIKARANKRDA